MNMKVEPDDDGVLRFFAGGKRIEIETGTDWRQGFPAMEAEAGDSESGWRGGYPVFNVPPVFDAGEVGRMLDRLGELGTADSEAMEPDGIVLRGVAEFDPASLAKLNEAIDTSFSSTRLVIDFDPEELS